MSVAAIVAMISASRHGEPPRPAEADVGAAGREDRVHVAGDAGHRHLRERDHAAVAAEEGQRERDEPEGQRLRADLEGEERRRHPRVDQHREQHEHVTGADAGARSTAPTRSRRARRSRPRSAARVGRAGRRARPHDPARSCGQAYAARPRVHRLAPVGRAHAPPPQDALRPEGQHQRHDHEREHHAVGRRVGEAELLGHADQDRPDGRAHHAAHAAHDDHDQRGEQVARVLARRDRQRGRRRSRRRSRRGRRRSRR